MSQQTTAFQPTLPARGATPCPVSQPPGGAEFQPTLPARGATRSCGGCTREPLRFQPTLPARGATQWQFFCRTHDIISTHAPRTGSDRYTAYGCGESADFNPRSPHGERPTCQKRSSAQGFNFNPRSPHGERHPRTSPSIRTRQFQPTLPARGATLWGAHGRADLRDFNPRSPHGERRQASNCIVQHEQFQPTLPARGATC